MNNKEILTKAISKAVENGYDISELESYRAATYFPYWWQDGYYNIIFSHDFAKAFWGELCKGIDGEWHEPYDYHCVPEWQFQLKKMVVCKEPLKYIERYL